MAAALLSHPSIRSAEEVDREGTTAFFLVEGEMEASLIDIVTRHHAFRLAPTRAEEGREHWNIGVARKSAATPMLDELARHGKLRVVRIAPDAIANLGLSQPQRRALRAAVLGGYYEIPRRVTPARLARELGISKSTLLEHLRKAEGKVILAEQAWY